MSFAAGGREASVVVGEIGRWSATGLVVAVAHVLIVIALLPDGRLPAAAELAAAIEVEFEAAAPADAAPTQLQPAPAATAASPSESAPVDDVAEEPASEAAPDHSQTNNTELGPFPVESNPQPAKALAEAIGAPEAPSEPSPLPAEISETAPEAQPVETTQEVAPEAASAEAMVEVARLPRARPKGMPRQVREQAEAAERPSRSSPPKANAEQPREAEREERKEAKPRTAPPPSQPSAPAVEPRRAAERVAPKQGAQAGRNSVSPERWQSAVFRHLERYKRYPRGSRVTGTVRARLTIDANGQVVRFVISGSSGHAVLDEAASEMIRRASPIPAPPSQIFQPGLTIEVPVRFADRD